MNNTALIRGIGLRTPLGLDTLHTAMAVMAGMARFGETSLYDKHNQPFVMSVLPDDVLPEIRRESHEPTRQSPRALRMLRLAVPALGEAMDGLENGPEIPLFLGAPDTLYGERQPTGDTFIDDLAVQAQVNLDVPNSRVYTQGRAAGITAIKEAVEAVTSGRFPRVLAGGVDTYSDPLLMASLDSDGRILADGVMDGFIPGEGAGFLLIESGNSGDTSFPYEAMILSAETGFENGHMYSGEAYKGEALARVFAKTLAAAGNGSSPPLKTICAGFNGEHFHTKEWGVARLRNDRAFDPSCAIEHFADCLGDTGAASGIIHTAVAAVALHDKHIHGPALIWGSSDTGARGAVMIDLV